MDQLLKSLGSAETAIPTGESSLFTHARLRRPIPFLSDLNEVFYLQSQNGNIGSDSSSEFTRIAEDVPSEISWASEALDKKPEAVNL